MADWVYYPLARNELKGYLKDMGRVTLIYDDSLLGIINLESLKKRGVRVVKASGDELPSPIIIVDGAVLTGQEALDFIKNMANVKEHGA